MKTMRPFSCRCATVSMPLQWGEVDDTLDPRTFTIKNAVERMERLTSDPCVEVLEQNPDLQAVLKRLAREVGKGAEA